MFYGHFWVFFGNVSVVWMKNWATLCKTKQKYANFCQISPNICKIVQKYALFCLKKTVKITFHPMKMCSKRGCLEASWVDVQCFCANWWRSRWLLNVCGHFWPFLTGFLLNGFFVTIDPFERFWNIFGSVLAIFDHFWLFWVLYRPRKTEKSIFWPKNRRKKFDLFAPKIDFWDRCGSAHGDKNKSRRWKGLKNRPETR